MRKLSLDRLDLMRKLSLKKLVLDMNTQLSVSLKLMRKLSCQGTRIARLSFSESLNVYTKT